MGHERAAVSTYRVGYRIHRYPCRARNQEVMS